MVELAGHAVHEHRPVIVSVNQQGLHPGCLDSDRENLDLVPATGKSPQHSSSASNSQPTTSDSEQQQEARARDNTSSRVHRYKGRCRA